MVQLSSTLKSRQELQDVLKHNPGIIIIKLGADWCGPCKRIDPIVKEYFNKSGNNCLCITIDIDESLDIFAMYKRYKVLVGVPGLLCYTQDEDSIYPNFVCNTGDPEKVIEFFNNCNKILRK